MSLGAMRVKPFSVQELLCLDDASGDLVGVHGVLFDGPQWTDLGLEFVLLPKEGGFDGINYDATGASPTIDEVLEVRDKSLAPRLRAADAPILTGGASYNIDAILIGRIQINENGRRVLTDLIWGLLHRAAEPEVFRRQEICMIDFNDHLPQLPWEGRTEWPDVTPHLKLFQHY